MEGRRWVVEPEQKSSYRAVLRRLPVRPAATGNIATEDLAYLLAECGCDTGVDLDRLIEAERLAESIVGRTLPGQVSKAGPRLRRYALDDARTAAG